MATTSFRVSSRNGRELPKDLPLGAVASLHQLRRRASCFCVLDGSSLSRAILLGLRLCIRNVLWQRPGFSQCLDLVLSIFRQVLISPLLGNWLSTPWATFPVTEKPVSQDLAAAEN